MSAVQSSPRTSEWREIEIAGETFYVTRFEIIGTGSIVTDAYEAYAGHSTARHHETFGQIGKVETAPQADWIERLPGGCAERITAAGVAREARKIRAEAAIAAAFPEADDAR